MSFCKFATSEIAVSAAAEICVIGFDVELTLIHISLVNGCLIMTPANSVSLFLRSSCCIIYKAPISASLIDKLVSFESELIT